MRILHCTPGEEDPARSRVQVSSFFAGADLIEPGVVQLHRWRAGTGDASTVRDLPNYGGVGRKP